MAYKTRRERRERGGKAAETEPLHPEHGNQYNAQGSPMEKSESAKSDGFKRGGMPKKKRKEGGKVEGERARHHLGRRARGGHVSPHVDLHFAEHHEHGGHDGSHHGGDHHPKSGDHEHAHHQGHHDGAPKRARGGHVDGEKGRRARGGSAPFSNAHKLTGPGNDKGTGPGEMAPTIP